MTAYANRMTPERIGALTRHIREHWGKIPVRLIAEKAGESYSLVAKHAADIGMPRLPKRAAGGPSINVVPPAPNGYSAETLKWARENAGEDREARMILAMIGKDVRKWR
jgi:hypothetical protein